MCELVHTRNEQLGLSETPGAIITAHLDQSIPRRGKMQSRRREKVLGLIALMAAVLGLVVTAMGPAIAGPRECDNGGNGLIFHHLGV